MSLPLCHVNHQTYKLFLSPSPNFQLNILSQQQQKLCHFQDKEVRFLACILHLHWYRKLIGSQFKLLHNEIKCNNASGDATAHNQFPRSNWFSWFRFKTLVLFHRAVYFDMIFLLIKLEPTFIMHMWVLNEEMDLAERLLFEI